MMPFHRTIRRRRNPGGIVLLAAVLAGAGASGPNPARPPAPIGGLWATDGYGLILEVGPDALQVFEVTKVSCIPAMRAKTSITPPGALGAFTLQEAPVTFVILPGSGAADARVHVPFAASEMIIRRIEKKPAACDTPTPNTPVSNFDVFAQTWAEHYPFFAVKKVDWAAVVGANRSRVTGTTTAEELSRSSPA